MPGTDTNGLSPPPFSFPLRETALAGVSMPFTNLNLGSASGAALTMVLKAASGRLSADPAFGATVSGGGTSSLWITGTAAQLTAKLATLVYAAGSAGDDTLSVSVLDAAGGLLAIADIIVTVLPSNSGTRDTITVAGGTLTLDTRTLDGLTLVLSQAADSPSPASLVLVNTTLGTGSLLEVATATPTGPRVAIAGQVAFAGSVRFGDGPAAVTLALGAVARNEGTIDFANSAAVISGGGTLHNDGAITVSGGALDLKASIAGSGSIALAPETRLALSGEVGAGQTIRFSTSDTLILGAPAVMRGTLAGFASGDAIVLAGATADAISFAASDPHHGLLTVYDGAATIATLDIANPAPGSFMLSPATVAGSVEITLSGPADPNPTGPAELRDVYRFFDTTHGTEFLTQDAGERDAIAATRPDLVYEGIAMHALPASAPNTEAVYRFFDTVHGTHFFTASASERDGLLSTRPDLVFEPGSTLQEHATQQPGDTPVFRFFNATAGTHFYTADAGERAHILSVRTDLKDEGIAFYAPTA